MAGISLSGSSIDFSQLTEAILADRSRPLAQLQSKSSDYTKRSDALKQLNSKLAALTATADALTNRDLGTGRLASSNTASVATATSTDEADKGTINLSVTRVATTLSQNSRVYASSSTAVLAGGATTATFELRKGGASTGTAITIDSSNNTLTGLRDAINGAGAGVTATIVDVDGSGTQNRLVLSSTATGAAGRVELAETTSTGTGADIDLTSLNPPGAIADFSGLDASFSLNGLSLTRSTNSISDVVSGVTFNLKGSGSAAITVSAKTTDLTDKVSNFINAYNDVQDFIAGQYKKDGQGRPGGPLAGDPTLRTVQQQLRDAVGGKSIGNGGALTDLTQIGISRDNDGKLTLDSAALNEKIANSFSDVQALFVGATTDNTGLANSIFAASNRLSDTVGGTVQTAINGFQDSITRLDKSISDQISRLGSLRESLTRRFAAVDAAINQLGGQESALTAVIDSLKPRDN